MDTRFAISIPLIPTVSGLDKGNIHDGVDIDPGDSDCIPSPQLSYEAASTRRAQQSHAADRDSAFFSWQGLSLRALLPRRLMPGVSPLKSIMPIVRSFRNPQPLAGVGRADYMLISVLRTYL